MSIKEKINERLDVLQSKLKNGNHLDNPSEIEELIESISKFWSVLEDEDREYIQAARYAIDNKMDWK